MGHLTNNPPQKKKSTRKSPFELQAERYEGLKIGVVDAMPALIDMIEEHPEALLGINLKLMDHGGWLAVAKRENGTTPEVIMSGGSDFIEALVKLDAKILSGSWRVDEWEVERRSKR